MRIIHSISMIKLLLLILTNWLAFAKSPILPQEKTQKPLYKTILLFENPTPQEIYNQVKVLSWSFKIPDIIIMAVIYQESEWQQFKNGGYNISEDNGIGIMQVTVPDINAHYWRTTLGKIVLGSQGDNSFSIETEQVNINIDSLKNDWKYNLQIGCRLLLAKKVECKGEGDDAAILENWYYPLAYYNGFSVGGNNDPARTNPPYPRRVHSSNDNDWKNKDIFPYQECVFNIIAHLYPLAQLEPEIADFFGDPIKVTLPGPSAVYDGNGHYNYVDPDFKGGDFITFYRDNRAMIIKKETGDTLEYENILVHMIDFRPPKVLSPVVGDLEVVYSLEQCSNTKWCFNQHKSGGHTPGGGICQANDTYAWDVNLNNPYYDVDNGKPVYSIADGVVSKTYGGCINAGGSYGQLLIEHNYQGIKWWSGYLHLKDIQVIPGDSVNQNTLLGYISNISADQYSEALNVDVVLVIDRSGSMGDENKMEDVKNAAKQFVDLMHEGDMIGVVSFNNDARVDFLLTLITSI